MKRKKTKIIVSFMSIIFAMFVVTIIIFNQPSKRIDRYIRNAKELIRCDKLDDAISELNKVFELDSDNPDGHILRADIFLVKEEFDDAIKEYELIMELVPERAATYLDCADIYIRCKEWDNAQKVYKKGIKACNDNRLIVGLARVEKKIKRIEMAKRNASMEKKSADPIGYKYRGWTKYHGVMYEFGHSIENIYENGRLTKAIIYNEDNQECDTITLEYDEYGNCIKDYNILEGDGIHNPRFLIQKKEWVDGVLVSSTDHEGGIAYYYYDKSGNQIRKEYSYGVEELYEYDNLGRMTRKYYGGGRNETLYYYDGKSKEASYAIRPSDKMKDYSFYTYKYDSFNRLIRKTIVSETEYNGEYGNSFYIYEYTYAD